MPLTSYTPSYISIYELSANTKSPSTFAKFPKAFPRKSVTLELLLAYIAPPLLDELFIKLESCIRIFD